MSYVPSPEDIRRTKQVIETATLLRWAEDSGFKTRRSKHGTSHIVCQHPDHADLRFIIVADTDKLSSQRDLSDCLKKLRKRENALTEKFESNATPTIESQYTALPAYLKATHDYARGHTIVHDRAIPQIGMTIAFADAHMLENKIRNILEPAKREVCELLNRAHVSYDIDIQNKCGKARDTMALSHAIYNMQTCYIQPYKADEDPRAIIRRIYDYIQKVEEKDFDHELRLESALKKDFIDSIDVKFHSRRGERMNIISAHDADGKPVTLVFETASNRRAQPGDVFGARIAEKELWSVERRISVLSSAHKQLSLEAA